MKQRQVKKNKKKGEKKQWIGNAQCNYGIIQLLLFALANITHTQTDRQIQPHAALYQIIQCETVSKLDVMCAVEK